MTHKSIRIDHRSIGLDHPPYVIAEMSGNHRGDIGVALSLMEAAKKAGADAIKLQTYTADTITLDHDGPGFVIEGGIWDGKRLYDLYQEASTPWDWHGQLFAKGRELGITVFSSPFDFTAVDFLETLDTPAYKIASFELNDIPLIEKVAATNKPLIMSTGMSDETTIAEALDAARQAGCEDIVLLHCISSYPTPLSQANLNGIRLLAERFQVPVGLSDHTLGTMAPTLSIALGASVIEKHFTTARADGGPDADFSLEPDELHEVCQNCRQAWEALGSGRIGCGNSEKPSQTYRRSLYAVADIAKGDIFSTDNIRSIRPSFGLAPKYLPKILGRKAQTDIVRGTPLSWEHVD